MYHPSLKKEKGKDLQEELPSLVWDELSSRVTLLQLVRFVIECLEYFAAAQ